MPIYCCEAVVTVCSLSLPWELLQLRSLYVPRGELFFGLSVAFWLAYRPFSGVVPGRKGSSFVFCAALREPLLLQSVRFCSPFSYIPRPSKGASLFYWETLDPNSSNSELLQRIHSYPLQNFLYAFDYPRWPYGYGIGTASLGLQYVARILHVAPLGIGVESGFGAIVLELGIVGLVLYIVLAAAIVITAWSAARKLKGTQWFPIGFVVFWYSFLFLFPYVWGGIQPFEDFILNSLFWFSLGILFRLRDFVLRAEASGNYTAQFRTAGTA